MAFAAATIGNLAAITGGDALETGVAVTSQRAYNYGYRQFHPLTSVYPSGATRINPHDAPPGQFFSMAEPMFTTPMRPRTGARMPVPLSGSSSLRSNPTPGVRYAGTETAQQIGSGVYTRIFPYPNDYNDVTKGFNERDSPVILYKGVRICRWFVNNGAPPVYVHYAIIQLKTGHYIDEINSEDTGIDNNFFRSYNESDRTDRQIDFSPYANAGAEPYKPSLSCNAMNPDRFYRILFRRTWKLAGNADPAVLGKGQNVKKFERYFRIKKLVHWRDTDSSTAADVEMPFVEVWWTNYANPIQAGTSGLSSQVTLCSNVAYFKSLHR